MNKQILIENNFDYDKSVERFVDNAELYETLLGQFPQENCFEDIIKNYEEKDFEAMFDNVHSMKGVTGNLGLTDLYKACCDLTEVLRAKNYDEVTVPYNDVIEKYRKACDIIEQASK